MQRRKVDNRIRVLIENGVAERQRALFVVVGDRGKDQVTLPGRRDCVCVVILNPALEERSICNPPVPGFSSVKQALKPAEQWRA